MPMSPALPPLPPVPPTVTGLGEPPLTVRSEEHTSELQSRLHLVCRLLLEKKKFHRLQYRFGIAPEGGCDHIGRLEPEPRAHRRIGRIAEPAGLMAGAPQNT